MVLDRNRIVFMIKKQVQLQTSAKISYFKKISKL